MARACPKRDCSKNLGSLITLSKLNRRLPGERPISFWWRACLEAGFVPRSASQSPLSPNELWSGWFRRPRSATVHRVTPCAPFRVRIRHGTSVLAELDIGGTSHGAFLGKVVSSDWPEELRAALDELLEVAEDQCLSLLDPVIERIAAWELRVDGLPSGDDRRVYDLQLCRGSVTFSLQPRQPAWLRVAR
jgi:hypothetical protein